MRAGVRLRRRGALPRLLAQVVAGLDWALLDRTGLEAAQAW
ncbi:hypothetical protein [Nonomuraea wenchangensis]